MSKKKPDKIATIEEPVIIEEPVYNRSELIAAAFFGVAKEVMGSASEAA